jgi:hypothetical protein
MLPAPRIIAIDDKKEHLQGLADGLNKSGIACLQVHFTGDDSEIKPCPNVRVIFADLHLNESGAGQGNERHFTLIGGLIEQTFKPTGPYVIVLWTRSPGEAANLKRFLDERLVGISKPFAVVPLDKNAHLAPNGTVRNPELLFRAIEDIMRQEVQIAALLNWEERVLGAAADTVSALLTLGMATTGTETASQRLKRLLYHLGAAGVGPKHVFFDIFHAVNEALFPILVDRVAVLKTLGGQDAIWSQTVTIADASSALSQHEAASLNRLSHIEDANGATGGARGAAIELPITMSGAQFANCFGISPSDTAEKFGCNGFVDADTRFRWMLIQVQAACDFAQMQAGPLPFALALEMPISNANKKVSPAVWTGPPIAFGPETKVLHVNSRFQATLPKASASVAPALYRIREQLLNELVYHLHSYGARPGHISFREEKAKGTPAGAPANPTRKANLASPAAPVSIAESALTKKGGSRKSLNARAKAQGKRKA